VIARDHLAILDLALLQLRAAVERTKPMEPLSLELESIRNCLGYYRQQRYPEVDPSNIANSGGLMIDQLRHVLTMLGQLKADTGNTTPQNCMLKGCLYRLRLILINMEQGAAMARDWKERQLPVGDRTEDGGES
jgi:hypothetical protein